MNPAVLILGATGAFGRRITAALAASTPLRILAASRHPAAAAGLAGDCETGRIVPLALDVELLDERRLSALAPALVIDTVGPFQCRERTLARRCAALGIHYLDLADSGAYVAGVTELDALARARGVLISSGASTVPALSAAAIEALAQGLSCVEEIDIGIAPGYRGPRGLATIRSILSCVGRPIPQWDHGRRGVAYGWSGRIRRRYPDPVGVRDLSLVDVPDTYLLPARFPGLMRLSVRAGIEVTLVHRALGALGLLVRTGLLRDLPRYAAALQRLARTFERLGSDHGAMHVSVRGRDAGGTLRVRDWTVIAEHGAGPQIPATAAVLIAKKLLGLPGHAPLEARGARPAVGLLTLGEFEREWQGLAIRTLHTNSA